MENKNNKKWKYLNELREFYFVLIKYKIFKKGKYVYKKVKCKKNISKVV